MTKNKYTKKIDGVCGKITTSRPHGGRKLPSWLRNAIITGGFTIGAISCSPVVFEEPAELYNAPPVDSGVDGDINSNNNNNNTNNATNNVTLYGVELYGVPDGGTDTTDSASDVEEDMVSLYGILPPPEK